MERLYQQYVVIRPSLIHHTCPGSVGAASKTGWTQQKTFTHWFDHVQPDSHPATTLLMMCGHTSHTHVNNMDVNEKYKQCWFMYTNVLKCMGLCLLSVVMLLYSASNLTPLKYMFRRHLLTCWQLLLVWKRSRKVLQTALTQMKSVIDRLVLLSDKAHKHIKQPVTVVQAYHSDTYLLLILHVAGALCGAD